MTIISDHLITNLSDAISTLDHHLARCYRWIWYVILRNQPADFLQQQLSEVEAAAPTTTPQLQLELAWKAQVIEELLNQ